MTPNTRHAIKQARRAIMLVQASVKSEPIWNTHLNRDILEACDKALGVLPNVSTQHTRLRVREVVIEREVEVAERVEVGV
jgi:hypothetical protein